ncbi:MAG: hypothetical protein B7Y45_01580 [Sphingomonas sp. 28-66-16]|nr:MAG: hypothetical protein B7Y45_01580 [Sphingomonas sp. 28-66-16]
MRPNLRSPIAALALLVLPVAAHAATPITGQWLTVEGKAIVSITECGQGVCGRITKVLKPNPNGATVDAHNPDPAKRGRPIEGLQILANFKDDGAAWRGTIYSPEAGKEYKSFVKRQPDGTLQVKGCIAFFCQTQVWKPAR